MSDIVLMGAGNCGRDIARRLIAQGTPPVVLADNNADLWNTTFLGIPVMSPYSVIAPDATWVISIGKPCRAEVEAQLRGLGVKYEMPWKYLNMHFGLPPKKTQSTIAGVIEDEDSLLEWCDQYEFRENPDYDRQRPPSDIKDIYFPEFITHLDLEHYVDCGAADGDTAREFLKWWKNYEYIDAFEPDRKNWSKAMNSLKPEWERISVHPFAVGDREENLGFSHTGDYSARFSGEKGNDNFFESALMVTLDGTNFHTPPTYIKMDIEGSELEALWGARRILKEHSPVLAVCAYHKSDDLWQIPLLIHALQPDYRLFLRRYSPGSLDLVWYAVSPERVK